MIVLAIRRIQDNFLVPKHEVVPAEKVDEVLKKYGITKEKLPKIIYGDPVIAEIGAEKGDVVRIQRKSPTAGSAVYFRLVV